MGCTCNKKSLNINLSFVWQKHPQFHKVIHFVYVEILQLRAKFQTAMGPVWMSELMDVQVL